MDFKLDHCAKNTEENEEEMLSGDGLHEDNQRSRTSFEVIARRFLSPTQWAKISNLLKFSQFILNSYWILLNLYSIFLNLPNWFKLCSKIIAYIYIVQCQIYHFALFCNFLAHCVKSRLCLNNKTYPLEENRDLNADDEVWYLDNDTTG